MNEFNKIQMQRFKKLKEVEIKLYLNTTCFSFFAYLTKLWGKQLIMQVLANPYEGVEILFVCFLGRVHY